MTAEMMGRIVAVVTENLHRRVLDATDPNEGDPFSDQSAAEQWLARTETESQLIADLHDDEGDRPDAIGELVAFAATAVKMWVAHTDHDPFALLQQIALQSATHEGGEG